MPPPDERRCGTSGRHVGKEARHNVLGKELRLSSVDVVKSMLRRLRYTGASLALPSVASYSRE